MKNYLFHTRERKNWNDLALYAIVAILSTYNAVQYGWKGLAYTAGVLLVMDLLGYYFSTQVILR